jgi:hypothetical protein
VGPLPSDEQDEFQPDDAPANDNVTVRRRGPSTHLRVSGGELLIQPYGGGEGVALGFVAGPVRGGLGLSRAEAEALAWALLGEAGRGA